MNPNRTTNNSQTLFNFLNFHLVSASIDYMSQNHTYLKMKTYARLFFSFFTVFLIAINILLFNSTYIYANATPFSRILEVNDRIVTPADPSEEFNPYFNTNNITIEGQARQGDFPIERVEYAYTSDRADDPNWPRDEDWQRVENFDPANGNFIINLYLDEGEYLLRTRAIDEGGIIERRRPIMGDNQIKIIIDKTAPQLSRFRAITTRNGLYIRSPFDLIVEVNEANGTPRCEYTLNDGQTWIEFTYDESNNRCIANDITHTVSEELFLAIRVTDKAGNSSITNTLRRIHDIDLPEIISTEVLSEYNNYVGRTFSFNVLTSDATSPITQCRMSYREIIDNDSNTPTYGVWSPWKNSNLIGNSSENIYICNISITEEDLSNPDFPPIEDGKSYQIRFRTRDAVLNLSPTTLFERPIQIDAELPSSQFDDPETRRFNGSIPLRGVTNDSRSGIREVILSYRNSPTDEENNTNNNEEQWIEIINIFTEPDENGQWPTRFEWEYNWTPEEDGVYDVRVQAIDNAYNIENTDYIYGLTFDTTPPTPVIPEWGYDVPPVGYVANSGTGLIRHVMCNGYITTREPYRGLWAHSTDNLSTTITYERQVAYTPNPNSTPNFVGTFPNGTSNYTHPFTPDTSTSANGGQGKYAVRIRAIDEAGNKSIDDSAWANTTVDNTWCFMTIDLTQPTVNDLSNQIFYHGDPIPSLSVTGDDNLGVDEICIEIVASPLGAYSERCFSDDGSTNNTSYTWTLTDILALIGFPPMTTIDTSIVPTGDYEFRYYVKDEAGHSSNIKSVTYTISNTPPTPTPTMTPTPTPEPSPTDTPTPSPSPTPSSTPTPSSSPTPSPEPTPSDTPTPSPSPTPSDTPSPSITPTPTDTPTPTPSATLSLTPTPTSTPTPSDTPNPTATPTTTPTVTNTPSPLPTNTPTNTPIPTRNIISQNANSNNTNQNNTNSQPSQTNTPTPTESITPTVNQSSGEVLGEQISEQCENKYIISGKLFVDKNNNNSFDEGDEKLSNIKIYLKDENNNIVSTVITNNDGNYRFEVCPNKYKIEIDRSSLRQGLKLENNTKDVEIKESNQENVNFVLIEESNNNWLIWLILIIILIAAILGISYYIYRQRTSEEL